MRALAGSFPMVAGLVVVACTNGSPRKQRTATAPDGSQVSTADGSPVSIPDGSLPSMPDGPPSSTPDQSPPAGGCDAPALASPTFEERAHAIAAEYAAWGRVDDELRWAPFLCRIPQPGVARVSASDHVATHGQKLYSIFAKNHAAYPNGPHTDQVIVKEAWTPELVTDATFEYDPEALRSYGDGGDHFYAYARKGGQVYRAAQRAGLYIMYKLDPCTADTDSGWVYATVDTNGQIATGRIGSCMTCHEDAEHERIFGLPISP